MEGEKNPPNLLVLLVLCSEMNDASTEITGKQSERYDKMFPPVVRSPLHRLLPFLHFLCSGLMVHSAFGLI